MQDHGARACVGRCIEGLHPETSDVALAVLGQMCEPSVGDRPKYPMLTPVTITDEAILAYKRATGTDREQARMVIHAAMESLQLLCFDVSFSSPIPGRGLFWQGDRLFHIVKIEHFQEDMFGEKKTVSTMWAVRAGLWASAWFTPDTRQYIGSLARVLLELGSQIPCHSRCRPSKAPGSLSLRRPAEQNRCVARHAPFHLNQRFEMRERTVRAGR